MTPQSAAAERPDDGDQQGGANSAKKLYKIKLKSGRVLGPFDLERISLFISKNKFTGTEEVRNYPTGDWKNINLFPEIAEIFLKKLEGKLSSKDHEKEDEPEISRASEESNVDEHQDSGEPIVLASTRAIKKKTERDEEGTLVITRDDLGTQMIERPKAEEEKEKDLELNTPEEGEEDGVHYTSLDELDLSKPSQEMAREKTVFLKAPPKNTKKKSIISPKLVVPFIILIGIIVVADMFQEDATKKKAQPTDFNFSVSIPIADKAKLDHQQSDVIYKSALTYYNLDTVDGYKKAASLFSKAIVMNPSNVRAIALLASSYINLVDVIGRDERFFQVVTGLIEQARAKQVDLAEVVIAEVELYVLLSNADAAIQRLVDHTKSILSVNNKIPVELFYYLSLSHYSKNDYKNAVENLDLIPQANWFSARIPYLYGLIFEKNNQLDQAIEAFEKAIKQSKNHIRARARLAEVFLRKDNLASAATQAEFVISSPELSSEKELTRARYIRARLHSSVGRNEEALQDLSKAMKSDPANVDILFEYYTIKARVTKLNADTAKLAKVYDSLARGEEALKNNDLQTALRMFLEARKFDETSPQPLTRIAEVFKREGNVYDAMKNYEKAVHLAPTREDLYPTYIKLAVQSYEFEAAQKSIEKYTALVPPPPAYKIDELYGILNFKKELYKDALLFFKRALQSASADSSLYLYYADILFKFENYKDAAFYYGIARRYDPASYKSILGIAKSISEHDGLDKGIKYLEDELTRTVLKAPLYVGLAEIYLRKNNTADAQKAIDSALAVDPKYYYALKVRGDIFQSLEKYKEAEEVYTSYLAVNNSDPSARIEKYKIAMRKPDYVAARKEMMLLLNQYPKYPGGHYMLGEVALRALNYQDALAMAELELKNNPGQIQALVLSGDALKKMGHYLKALERFNQALLADSNYIPALKGAGYTNHRLKSYAAAQTQLERAVKLDTGDPDIRKLLGSLYFDMGMKKDAIQQLRVYLDLSPGAADRVEIERMIQ